MPKYFDELEAEIPAIRTLPQKADATGYFIQEAIRFYSIAGTLLSNGFALDASSSIDERYLTHTLTRSLLEPFFVILYIFDDSSQTNARYEEQKSTFKEQYRKLMNDLNAPEWQRFMQSYSGQLEVADPTWTGTNKLPDVKAMLGKLSTSNNTKLDFLYPLYRITSFDTHGRSLATIFEAVFGKQCSFPVLIIKDAIELMANQYLAVLSDLRKSGAI
ncbi:hypothetical protein CQ052_03905 [Ochrobactrum sp. MYb15]|nr:hypothetical protein CQZ90_04985 [Ochrobactrum sp. MYb19]PRA62812.1 hypothetical protein CQ053_18370 [Ochrobactrum sp. MYb18]PRA76535.1 hypothetical protein CQ049_03905 [Brucella thiophenivorans]PRA93834.1 hypothetical protein CQ051_04985 [Ochrobactrum sp. MYb14]PRA98542.1 hypothetical protein CQ052_03905 [Ochrobactrum sp. MYb15]